MLHSQVPNTLLFAVVLCAPSIVELTLCCINDEERCNQSLGRWRKSLDGGPLSSDISRFIVALSSTNLCCPLGPALGEVQVDFSADDILHLATFASIAGRWRQVQPSISLQREQGR